MGAPRAVPCHSRISRHKGRGGSRAGRGMNGTALAGKRKWSGLGRTHAVADTIDVPGEGVASPASKRSKRALQDDEDDLLKHLDAGYEMETARYRDEDARREGNGDILRDGVDDLSVRSIAATVLMALKAGRDSEHLDAHMDADRADSLCGDVLQHLDAAYDEENVNRGPGCGSADTTIGGGSRDGVDRGRRDEDHVGHRGGSLLDDGGVPDDREKYVRGIRDGVPGRLCGGSGGDVVRCRGVGVGVEAHDDGVEAVRGIGGGTRDDGINVARVRGFGVEAHGDSDGGDTVRVAVVGAAAHGGGMGAGLGCGTGIGVHNVGDDAVRVAVDEDRVVHHGGCGHDVVAGAVRNRVRSNDVHRGGSGGDGSGGRDNGANPALSGADDVRDVNNVECELNVRAIASFALDVVKWKRIFVELEQTRRLAGDAEPNENFSDTNNLLRESISSSNRDRNRLYQKQWRKRKTATSASTTRKKKLAPLSCEDRANVLKRLQQALGPEGLDECVCVSCDRLVRREQAQRKDAADWQYMDKMRRSFGDVDPTLPRKLRDEYSAPAFVTYLRGAMVSPRSFHHYTNTSGHLTAWFSVCKTCNESIQRGCLPKFSISNGFFVGSLPDDHSLGLTLPERFMTQLVSIAAMTRVMRGGRHRCIRSHCIAFDCTSAPPVALLPRSINECSNFRVALVGDFTEAQTNKVRKMHAIRGQRIQDVFNFYKVNNCLYSSVARNDKVLNELFDPDLVDQIDMDQLEDASGTVRSEMSKERENIRGHSDDWNETDAAGEVAVIERRIGLSDASKVLLSQDHELVSEGVHDGQTEPELLVKRSNQLSMDVSGTLLAKMFPHLFPYGRGHPGETRREAVSLKECVKHYTMLSGRYFAEDELFTVVSFDLISMKNMYTQNSIRCQRFPEMYNGYDTIDADALRRALLENEQRRQGQRPVSREPRSLAHKFLKTVEIASAAVWGSNAERFKCRQKAIAYQTRFGQPSLFITLTPNTDNSLAMAYYAGKASVNSLFDVLEAQMPSKAELREASLGNDSASARLFMYQVSVFIKHVLGMDPVTKQQMPFAGLLGEVSAYFGMVETQGRGTLHIHFLIWLANVPSSTSELEKSLNGPDCTAFRASVISYVDTVVSNKLPLPFERYSCAKCGSSYTEIDGLPIPTSARQNPRRQIFSARKHKAIAEPALLYCKQCKTKVSSQHVLRNLLLQARPVHWPPWERQLTAAEIEHVALAEAGCRDTIKHAVDVVNDRERVQMALRNESSTLEDAYGLISTPDMDQLSAANASQMKFCSSEDDPFQSDFLSRFIEISPPMVSDNRMGRNWMDYMVSKLVVLLNQHWWCHTSSCFKMSKTTVNDSYCRYNFPRSRRVSTTFDLSGVALERPIAHEFINGFNSEIMAAFKCNHDVRVLLGGKDSADRIHYCTKYVTKQQKRLDSVVVMALAAFRRRQQREAVAASIDTIGSADDLARSRKRVASMVYTMTNRQEIAGPLAALYLYRGSCCYDSSGCSFLPLRDMIHQLCSTEEYSCQLVSDREESADSVSSRYLAVSFLDDYIYRSGDLDGVYIYEFAMWYFRKKDEHALASNLPFKAPHPLYRTHSLGKRRKEAVPVVQGFRIPFLDENSPDEVRHKHAILSLVLFKPFRSLSDLIGASTVAGEQWINAFKEWEPTRSDFVRMIMNHIDDYYCGVDRAKYQSEDTKAAQAGSAGVDESSSDDDSLFSGDEFDGEEDELASLEDNENFINPWLEVDVEDGVPLDSQGLHPAICPTAATPDGRITRILDVFRSHRMLLESAQSTIAHQHSAVRDNFPSVPDMRKWVQNANTDCSLRDSAPAVESEERGTSVELFSGALQEDTMMWSPLQQPVNCQTIEYATITDISRGFTLNEKQHYAFKHIGAALLTRWRNVEDMTYLSSNFSEALESDQLRMFLGGEGGTGKSRVLDAVQSLCASWKRPDCLIKTALTGKAATVIGGRTLASLMIQLKRKRNASSAICIDIIVIDEVSMMRKSQLAQLDKLLRAAKRFADVAFGGVHVVLVGDFLQLPPVGGEPLYKDPWLKCNPAANELAGYQLWLSFTDVIVLEESVRFRADPDWGRGCRLARQGVWLPEFVDIINSRIVGNPAAAFHDWSPGSTVSTFITPDNTTRLSINNLFISTAAKLLPQGEYPIRVVANFKDKLSKLGSTEVKMVMALPDSKFGRMAPYLDLIVGMPIQLTQNVRAEKMAANGTHGVLEAICFSPGTTFRVIYDSAADVTVKIPSVSPPAVIVRIPRGSLATSMHGCTDSNLFPLFSNARPFNLCDIKLAPSRSGIPRSLSVRVEQFPMVCAVSSTVYKVQGETLKNMVVTEWRSENRVTNKRQQPYLLVSRVTSREAFRTLRPLTADIIKWARPPIEALEEDRRLQHLSNRTLGRLIR